MAVDMCLWRREAYADVGPETKAKASANREVGREASRNPRAEVVRLMDLLRALRLDSLCGVQPASRSMEWTAAQANAT